MILTLALHTSVAAAATAPPPVQAFNVPRQPLVGGLIALATQAGVSISTAAASQCRAEGQAVVGRLSLPSALRQMLEGTGCGFRMIDPRAVEIVVLPPPRPAATATVAASKAAPVAVAPTASLAELVVVATRRPTAAGRLAYPVSALDAEALRALGVHDTADLASLTPSMTVTNLGAGRDKILLRGLSDGPLTGRTQSTVGLYLDDVRLTYNAPDPDLRLIDMAQVEVLRGPQGALYGAGSLGGVVQFVTVQPKPGVFGGWVAVTGSSAPGADPSNAVEGVLNLPMLAGRAAIRLVAYRDVQGGYINDAALGVRRANEVIVDGGRLTATLALDDRWTVSGRFVSQSINAADTQYALPDAAPYTRNNRVREPHDNDFQEANVGLKGMFDWGEARWTTAIVRHRVASRYDATAAPPVPVPAGAAAFDDSDAITSVVSEATLASSPGSKVQWLAGVFLSRSWQDVDLTLTSLAAIPTVGFSEARREQLEEAALFGEAALPVTRRLTLTVGGRVFSSDTRVRSTIRTLASGGSAFTGAVSHAGFAPKVVVAYAPNPGLLFYVQAAEGYRSGGVNTSGAPGQVFSPQGGPEPYRYYQGDELWSYEAGLRAAALEGRLTVRAAVFQARWRNIQSDQLLASGLPFTANIGDGRSSGLELESAYRAGPLTVRGEFLINAPELDRANPAFPARPELGLAGVPSASAGVSAQRTWALGDGFSLALDGRYAYVGASHLTFDAATSPRMGGYSTERLAASLSRDSWSLTVAADNPANERSNTFAYGNPFTLRTTPQITPMRPRTLSISLRVAY